MPFGKKTLKGRKKNSKETKLSKNSHTGHHNADNSLKTQKRDGSNRYKNSDKNREYDILGANPEMQKTHTIHTTYTEKDYIT